MKRRQHRPVPVDRDNPKDPAGPAVYGTPPLEKDVQRVISSRAEAVGFTVRSTSQYRASHVSEGFADLYLAHRAIALAVWWETKTYDGKAWRAGRLQLKPRSPVQLEFAEDMAACKVQCGWGALPEFFDFLLVVGLAARPGGIFMLTPKGRGIMR